MGEPGESVRVVYIMGLSRCGSTILQFLLASHPRAVGMGEVEHTIRRYGPDPQPERPTPCSCGAAPEACPMWAPLLPELGALDPGAAHRRILARFAACHPGRVLVDNSKTRRGLAYYLDRRERRPGDDATPPIDLRVIHVVRDFRAWSVSMVRGLARRDPQKPHIAPPGPVRGGYAWLVANGKALAMLARRRVRFLHVSYDELATDTDAQLERVGRFVGLELRADALDLATSTHHDLFGNPMKQDDDRRARVVYSEAWRREWNPGLAAPLLAPVYAINAAARQLGRRGRRGPR